MLDFCSIPSASWDPFTVHRAQRLTVVANILTWYSWISQLPLELGDFEKAALLVHTVESCESTAQCCKLGLEFYAIFSNLNSAHLLNQSPFRSLTDAQIICPLKKATNLAYNFIPWCIVDWWVIDRLPWSTSLPQVKKTHFKELNISFTCLGLLLNRKRSRNGICQVQPAQQQPDYAFKMATRMSADNFFSHDAP